MASLELAKMSKLLEIFIFYETLTKCRKYNILKSDELELFFINIFVDFKF